MNDILKNLNEAQRIAASHIDGPLLILAGAGSGKTATITTRLAYLIDEIGISPDTTLTLTFTNKAAKEMKQRALKLLKHDIATQPMLCTFHKFGLEFLNSHMNRLNRNTKFTIIDENEKKKIIKSLIDTSKENLNNYTYHIGMFKNNAKDIIELQKDASLQNNEKMQKIIKVYSDYEDILVRNNYVDFDDMILLPLKILENDDNFAKEISQKYNYITVDEYQDTNELQYKLLKKLCSAHNNLCVVGDDDQSIYKWRGAKIENILNFKDQFPNTKVIKLEHNYRSNTHILNIANKLIQNNSQRLGKELKATIKDGQKPIFLNSPSEKEEAITITNTIKDLIKKGVKANQIAIIYRVNALSRSLEEVFRKHGINYKILSGMDFYDRAEIKDVIAYLRLLANSKDDYAFARIINVPKRGFGDTSLEKLKNYAKEHKLSLYEALYELKDSEFFHKKLDNNIKEFINSIENLKDKPLIDILNDFEKEFKLKAYYKQEQNQEKAMNIDEFYASFKENIASNATITLNQALNEASLQSDQDKIEGDNIYMMSVHASKGLEFDHVFIVGLEEGFFPIECDEIEEERRLAYVAITRAKKSLYLSSAYSRFYHGTRMDKAISRFITEITKEKKSFEESMKEISAYANEKLKKIYEKKEKEEFSRNEIIKHKIFGIGKILNITKSGKEIKLEINFGGIKKTLLSSYINKVDE